MQWALQQFLERSALLAPKLSGLQFGFTQTELAEIEFGLETGAGPLSAKLNEVKVGYELGAPKIETVSVSHARLKFAYHPSDKPPNQEPSAPGAVAFPLERLSVENLEIDIDTPWGLTRFAGRGEIRHGEAETLDITLQNTRQSVRIELGPGFRTAKVIVEHLPNGRIFDLSADHLDQPNRQARLHADAGLLAEWLGTNSLVPESLRANLSKAGLPGMAPGLSAIQLDLNAETPDKFDSVQGTVLLSRDSRNLASANLSMTTPSFGADLDAQLDMTAKEVFELLKPWLPKIPDDWQLSAGNIKGTLNLRWQTGRIRSGTARLNASELALTAGSAKLEAGKIELDVSDLVNRSATLAADAPKLEFGKGLIANKLIVKTHYLGRELTVDQAALSIFGGQLEILPGPLDVEKMPLLLTLRVHAIDLAQLLSSLDYKDLSGTGTVNGELPLRLSMDAIELQDGALTGTRPGVLRYQGPTADKENIAFKALRNLSYHSLQAKVNYRPNGDYHLGFRLEGSNPEVLSGHPLAFNLNISGQLPELLRRGIQAGDFEKAILEQATTKPAKPLPKPSIEDQQPKPPPADRRN
jgi:hypothetical protein